MARMTSSKRSRNPFAICNAAIPGGKRRNPAKFERCVLKVKRGRTK